MPHHNRIKTMLEITNDWSFSIALFHLLVQQNIAIGRENVLLVSKSMVIFIGVVVTFNIINSVISFLQKQRMKNDIKVRVSEGIVSKMAQFNSKKPDK